MATIRTGVVERPIPGGGKKYFATGVHSHRIDDDGLIDYMLQKSQVGRTSAVAAVEAFKAAFTTFLMNGHTMQVPALGTFSLTCGTDTKKITKIAPQKPWDTDEKKEQAKEWRKQVQEAIDKINVRFTPARRMRNAAKSVSFQQITLDED